MTKGGNDVVVVVVVVTTVVCVVGTKESCPMVPGFSMPGEQFFSCIFRRGRKGETRYAE